jgi:thiol:disulfide interchange protein
VVSKSDLARTTALVSLPLAAFLLGPALDAIAPESIPGDLLLALLPTVLPLAALVVVAVVSYRRTGSTRRALRLTALAFAVGVVGATGYLLHVWSEASGS